MILGGNVKKKIILIIAVLIILSIIVIYYLYNKKVDYILEENLVVSLNSEINTSDYISLKNGTLVSISSINTDSPGKKEVNVILKNKLGHKYKEKFYIEVKDVEPPKIEVGDITINVGTKIDLSKYAKVTDNYDTEVKLDIMGDYDISKSGKYEITYKATDSSGNETSKKVNLIVNKIANSNNGTTYFKTSKGFDGYTKDGVTYIGGILVANKTYSLPSNYGNGLTKETTNAFNKMKQAAKNENLNIYISSGFRSYATQKTLYNNYVARDGKVEADTYSARAGFSEHQTGLAFDVNTISSAFNDTKEAIWLRNNCYKYGFILRYPKGKENETGYIYESWHFRYVGEEIASKLYNNGDWITLESYFGITSKYN